MKFSCRILSKTEFKQRYSYKYLNRKVFCSSLENGIWGTFTFPWVSKFPTLSLYGGRGSCRKHTLCPSHFPNHVASTNQATVGPYPHPPLIPRINTSAASEAASSLFFDTAPASSDWPIAAMLQLSWRLLLIPKAPLLLIYPTTSGLCSRSVSFCSLNHSSILNLQPRVIYYSLAK